MYRINRIRLVNFHNIQNETIEVSGGGHLFLLGDNGSGKTTILDAVHYVLTGGGNLMEFNSAARMAGSRQDGRRVQGIVLRYNVDTGPMNASGGVSYAALELIDEKDNLLTIGVGLSAYSLEERIQRWGIILSGPLESVPWLSEEGGRIRVTHQKEIRDALLSKGAFYTIGAYEKELARRVFNNDEIFAETCRFLSMGKAYREIATSAADYHQLFKTLLPEPKTDLFDRIIDSLKTLDEATTLLEDMEKKLQYLAALEELVKTISDQRESLLRYGWLKIYFERNQLSDRIGTIDGEQEQIRKLLSEINRLIAFCRDEQVALQRRIDDLRSADSAGLVRQEKELAQDILSRKKLLEISEQKLTDTSEIVETAEKQCSHLKDELTAKIDLVREAVAKASVLEPQLTAERIAQLQNMTASEHAVNEIRQFQVDDLTGKIENHLREFHRELDRLSDQHKNRLTERESHSNERENLFHADALRPPIDGLEAVLNKLNAAGIENQLLYEQLEWNEDIDTDTRSSMEECIGVEILSIIMVQDKVREQASTIVFETAPGIKIYIKNEQSVDIPDWIRTGFDLRATHPAAAVCLAEEMISLKAPSVDVIDNRKVLSFHAHKQRLTGEISRWIGQEERRKALESRIAELDRMINNIDKECIHIQSVIDTLDRKIDIAVSVREKIIISIRSAVSISEQLFRAFQEYSFRKETYEQESRRYSENRDECDRMEMRHETLHKLIRSEGLEDLELRIGALDEESIVLDEKFRGLLREEGQKQGKLGILKDERTGCEERDGVLAKDLSAAEEKIKMMVSADVTDISYYILRSKLGASFKNTDSIESATRDAQRKEAASVGTLNEKLRDPVFGALYGFGYTEKDNLLVDRRNRLIGELTTSERTAIEEQRQVINEKTAELFKKIIVNEMVSFFARHLSRLEQMVRTINDLLSHRTFGTTRYRLELQKEERFAPFIDAVRKFNPFAVGSEETLRQFIDDHRDEIINSEIETVPAVLDYRNWYTYHLRMFTANDEGILIDRRTKSVGSGGEQAVPNYLTILTIAHFLFKGNAIKLCTLLFDEAFYGIDAGRRDQLLGFASDIGLQLLVASPDQDGVRKEVPRSTTLLVVKDARYDVHLYPFHWENQSGKQLTLFDSPSEKNAVAEFGDELVSESGEKIP
jgi:energy-coupling factor transporter ATP-binding protein EcfA2